VILGKILRKLRVKWKKLKDKKEYKDIINNLSDY